MVCGLISMIEFCSIGPPVCSYAKGCFKYCSSVVEFEVSDINASRSSFIVQDCICFPVFFYFSILS